jgi:lipoprotein-anchoring transpeptidase ErfK/SrfK
MTGRRMHRPDADTFARMRGQHGVWIVFALLACAVPAPAQARTMVQIASLEPLHVAPGGPTLRRGGYDVLESGVAWVVQRRPGWLAIPSRQLPGGRLGWIRERPDSELSDTPTFVRVSLSDRRVWITRGSGLLLNAPVAIGAPSTPTPVASTSVAEIIPVAGSGIYSRHTYGPVIVALRLAQSRAGLGFPDGGIVAFHGGDLPQVGTAASAGCLRMRNADLLRLSQLVGEGTPVQITR